MSSEELKMRDKSMLWSIDLLSIAVLVSRFPPRLYPAAPWERQTEESLIRRIHFDHFDLNGKSLHHRHQAVSSNCAGCFHEFSWWFHDVSVFFLIYFACYLRALHFGFLQIQRRTHAFWTPRMQHGAHLIEFVCRQMCFLRGNKDVHLINWMFFFVPGVSQSWNARWWRMQNSEFFINELNMHKNAKNINKSSLCLQKDARCCVKVKVYIATFAGIDVSQPSGTLWKPQRENIARQSGVGYVQRIDSPFSDKRDETG